VIFNLHMFNAPRFNSEKDDGVRCAHFPSVITTIMDQKVQLIDPLNLGELYAA
jgi:hypothetical protein